MSVLGVLYEPRREISNNVVCTTNKTSDQPAHMRNLISLSLEYSMTVKLLTEHQGEHSTMLSTSI